MLTHCNIGGDELVQGNEECDGGIGCIEQTCRCAAGFVPTTPPSRCCRAEQRCGDGRVSGNEQCEPGGAGCDAFCRCAAGYTPTVPPSFNCRLLCGDGVIQPPEQCEVGDIFCGHNCRCLPGFVPSPVPGGGCVRFVPPFICGNGQVDPGEECDGGFGCQGCRCVSGTVPTSPPSISCIPPLGVNTCSGRPFGFTCVTGVTSHYLQCTPPFFTGLRPCAPGTTCSTSNFITDFSQHPCQ